MYDALGMVLTILGSVLASSGFWAYMQRRTEKKDVKRQMLMGLGHDRIIYLGTKYIERGYLSMAEYENLMTYLYKPYAAMGGNGTAERIIREVEKLDIREHDDPDDEED